jgi:hypothetical protein
MHKILCEGGDDMKKIQKIFIYAVVILLSISLFAGCSSSSKDNTAVNYDQASAGDQGKTSTNNEVFSPQTTGESGGGANILGEKMIYVARISIETLEFDKTLKDIENYVVSLGGFVESSSISGIGEKYETSASSASGYAEIYYRIPAKQYTGFLDNIKTYGNVIAQSTSSENITTSYYDTDGRLKAYRTAEQRLLEILLKADAVTDMLEIEKELTNVRANIEGLTSQLKAWDNLVDYSTIIISIHEVEKITDTSEPDTFGEKLIKTIERSFDGFLNFLKGILIFLLYVLPYAIVLTIILLIVRKVRGRSFFIRKPKK